MAARVAMIWNQPTFKVSDTEAGLATGEAFECQVTSAVLTPSPVYATVPSTGCAGASQSPGLTGWALALAWLQDWSADGGGLSNYALTNDGLPKWCELVPNKADATVGATFQAYVSPGGMGGTFGDGSAAATTASWPLLAAPVIDVPPAVPLAADTELADAELADANA